MARRGRPVQGTQLLDGMEGSHRARERLRVILQTLSGQITIEAACQVLSIGRSGFHALRRRFLAEASSLLEPRPTGRKPRQPSVEQLEIERLRQQVVQLKLDLKAVQVREEIALVMPHLLGRKRGEAGKKTRRAGRNGTRGGCGASKRS